jgi:hypothetical protein
VNDVPVTTTHETRPSRKKLASAGVTPGGISDIVRCAEGEELKQRYDSTLQNWAQLSQPSTLPEFERGASGPVDFQLRKEALIKRNEAANRLYLHRARCAPCRRVR